MSVKTGAEYFMIRIHRHSDQDSATVAGAIEHLGTGEKLTLLSGEELLRILGSRPNRMLKVSPGTSGVH